MFWKSLLLFGTHRTFGVCTQDQTLVLSERRTKHCCFMVKGINLSLWKTFPPLLPGIIMTCLVHSSVRSLRQNDDRLVLHTERDNNYRVHSMKGINAHNWYSLFILVFRNNLWPFKKMVPVDFILSVIIFVFDFLWLSGALRKVTHFQS